MLSQLETFVHPDTFGGALLLLVIFVFIGLLLSALMQRAIRLVLDRDQDKRIDRLGANFLAQIGQVFVWVFILMLYAHAVPVLNKLGTALLASVSIASVVLGLAAQSTLANLVAGLSLVFYRPFRLGDRLRVTAPGGTETGTVETVSLGYTIPRAEDERRIVLSNSTISNAVMVNLTSVGVRVLISVPFRIAFDADVSRARRAVLNAVARPGEVVEGVEEVGPCLVAAFDDVGLELVLKAWVVDIDDVEQATSGLLERIKAALEAEGMPLATTPGGIASSN